MDSLQHMVIRLENLDKRSLILSIYAFCIFWLVAFISNLYDPPPNATQWWWWCRISANMWPMHAAWVVRILPAVWWRWCWWHWWCWWWWCCCCGWRWQRRQLSSPKSAHTRHMTGEANLIHWWLNFVHGPPKQTTTTTTTTLKEGVVCQDFQCYSVSVSLAAAANRRLLLGYIEGRQISRWLTTTTWLYSGMVGVKNKESMWVE